MIPHPARNCQTIGWQQALAQAIRNPAELLALLDLPASLLPAARRAAAQFPLRVTHSYLAQIKKGDPHDPLLRQVLPLGEEQAPCEGFSQDPVGDLDAMPVPGLLHKYAGRVLLVTTGACAIHCRYCFRRHFPYAEANPASTDWQAALDYIAADASVSEVILSGGDPLSLSDSRLAALVGRLAAIPHLKRLRLHTRLPVVLPERVDPALVDWLGNCALQTIMVIHVNHANEVSQAVRDALGRLRGCGVSLLNQSVLLRGVNDNLLTLAALSEALFAHGVLPYYLHQLDRVQGAAHFAVSDSEARRLLHALRETLPGYMVPQLVRDQPGQTAKIPLESLKLV
ncbi:MAG: EF-P beta-lysylation protein EpmB [Proteobacteria bacterium]|jgi:EF-P beta-lysylation protein EpmB|nr:EF-P beta-lysylation protein EpmB [Pseudomonadota bacterium]